MPTDPSSLPGYVSNLSLDVDNIAGADGSAVLLSRSYSTPSGFSSPTLKLSAINGHKSLVFAPGKGLLAPIAAVTPAPTLSGGGFPTGFSAVILLKPNNLSALTANPLPRRTFLGFRDPSTGGASEFSGWSILPSGKQEPSLLHHKYSGWWGQGETEASGTITVGPWQLLGLRSNGETVTLWKGKSTDLTATNAYFASGYTQFIDGLCLGADASFSGRNDFDGEIAHLAIFNRAITNQEYIDVADWLIARYGLSTREIAVDAVVGTTGKDLFLLFKSATTDKPVFLSAPPTTAGFRYRVNGGPAITATQVIAPDTSDANVLCSHVAIPLATPVTSGDTLTVSIAAGALATQNGPVDELVDGPVTNMAGQASMLSGALPATVTMKQGYNVISPGTYWTPEISLKNIFKANGDDVSPWTQDANGYRVNPPYGFSVVLRSGSGNSTSGDYHVYLDGPGVEFGRYVVSWDGADGSDLALYALDDQTTVTAVHTGDVLTGSGKKRYFDVTEAPGSIRKRPAFLLQYRAAVYCTNIDVRLARYEGESGHWADQVKSRLNGMHVVRFVDFQQISYSNIANPGDFSTPARAWYGDSLERYIPITRVESHTGAHYAPDDNYQHYLVTFSEAHGLVSGQQVSILSTNGQPVNIVLADGTRDLNGQWGHGFVLSSTTFYMPVWRGGGTVHQATVTPFTGANAHAQLKVKHGAPLEVSAALATEANLEAIHIHVPHAATDTTVAHMATVLAGSLEAGKQLWIEYTNEPWNPSYNQWQYLKDEAVRRGVEGWPSFATARIYALRSTEVWDVFRAAWQTAGRSQADLRLVFNTQHGNSGYTTLMANWLKANRPELHVHLEVAPYYPPNPLQARPGVDYAAWTVDRIMDYHEALFRAWPPAGYVADHKAIMDGLGLSYTIGCYENQFGYLGMSARNTELSGAPDILWEQYNKEALAVYSHPRVYNMAMHQLRGCQAAGLSYSTWYGYQHGIAFEYTNQGHSHYGDFPGLVAEAGRGDGSDGKPDNRPLVIDGQGKPKWPDYYPRVSPRAGARAAWQAAIVGGTIASELTAQFGPVSPDPRTTPVDSIGISFSGSVTGFDLTALYLYRSGMPISLAGASLTGSGSSYSLTGLGSKTSEPGPYTLLLFAPGSTILGASGERLLRSFGKDWTVVSTPILGGRRRGDQHGKIGVLFRRRVRHRRSPAESNRVHWLDSTIRRAFSVAAATCSVVSSDHFTSAS